MHLRAATNWAEYVTADNEAHSLWVTLLAEVARTNAAIVTLLNQGNAMVAHQKRFDHYRWRRITFRRYFYDDTHQEKYWLKHRPIMFAVLMAIQRMGTHSPSTLLETSNVLVPHPYPWHIEFMAKHW